MSGRPLAFVAIAVSTLAPGEANAYLDPATGSLIIQTVVGGVAAAALAIKTYWRQIKARLEGSREASDDDTPTSEGPDDRHGHR